MNNFGKPLKEMTDNELINWIDNNSWDTAHIPLMELDRRALNRFQETVEKFNDQSSKQTKKMINLTWWIVSLTILMCFGLALQIFLAIR